MEFSYNGTVFKFIVSLVNPNEKSNLSMVKVYRNDVPYCWVKLYSNRLSSTVRAYNNLIGDTFFFRTPIDTIMDLWKVSKELNLKESELKQPIDEILSSNGKMPMHPSNVPYHWIINKAYASLYNSDCDTTPFTPLSPSFDYRKLIEEIS